MAKLFATSLASKAPHLKRSRSKQNPNESPRTLPAVLTPNGPAIMLIYLFFFFELEILDEIDVHRLIHPSSYVFGMGQVFKIRGMKFDGLLIEYNIKLSEIS